MVTAPEIASLTQSEAEERAALLSVRRYDIAVDVTGLLEGDTVLSTSTIDFECRAPGATTFVDCVAAVSEATLNGVPLDPATCERGRLPLPDLRAENVLVVTAAQSDTASGAGIQRTVDPSDKLVYVWTSFEADDARRLWACFDQPDLKAPHAFAVSAPESWTVTSNDAPAQVAPARDGARLWTFPDTPPLSTYVVVINAGPFHELRREVGGHSLGLYCRQSLRGFLERDADELFDLTAAGLAFYADRFGMPFPQVRYDTVFVPDMGGAMENWGCVTWSDDDLFRAPPTYSERSLRAWILLHEMAHMWFGNLVTMRWWDDLWLNEAFASWASTWCADHATEFTDGWATFLAEDKVWAYRQDMSPSSHPIRGEIPDVSAAMANFDTITYLKGQSVLKQLVAAVGEDAFVAALGQYFRDHAWGNARLDDLMGAVAAASGRDLSGWTRDWLDRAGTDTITLELDGDGAARLVVMPPDGEPRAHTLIVGSYAAEGERWTRVAATRCETTARSLPLSLPRADLHLVNDDDLTFAAARPEAGSLRRMLDGAGSLPDPIGRAVAVVTAWDMLVKAELGAGEFLTCVLGVLTRERTPGLVGPFLTLATTSADEWTAASDVARARSRVADVAMSLLRLPDVRLEALHSLADTATTSAHFETLEEAADEPDLAWRVLVRRAELGDYDERAVRRLVERDPDPEAESRSLTVRAALADPEAKDEVWKAVFEDRAVHVGTAMSRVGRAFWRPGQDAVLLPFAARYLDELANLGSGGVLDLGSLVSTMFPRTADAAFLERARVVAADPGTVPLFRSILLTRMDTLQRQLRARAL